MILATTRVRIAVTAVLFAMLFLVVVGRAVYVSIIQGPELRALAARQHQRRVSVLPERGPIVDRHGEPLALTVDVADVFVHPSEVASPQAVQTLAGALGISPDRVAKRIASKSPFVWLDRQVSLDRWRDLAALRLPGVGSEPSRRRHYPHGGLAAHVLGFTNIDAKGIDGLELRLNDELLSQRVPVRVELDAHRRAMDVEGGGDSSRGVRVELTLDAALQHVAETEIEAAVSQHHAEAGIVVVLDPRTGQVLAMANAPGFDPNEPGLGPVANRRNRVVTDFFEPGSTFKAITAAAAIEAGVVSPAERIYCENGSYPVGRRVVHDHDPLGWLTFSDVIAHSSNIGTAKIGERLGRDRLAAAISAFGFGERTGIDLPAEVAGMVRPVDRWGRIHLVTTSFGQGIAVTPLQMVRAFGAIANGGLLMKPYLVQRVVGEDGRLIREQRPEVIRRVISPGTARTVTAMLQAVVESGTGTKAQMNGFSVAGKTGTAQKVDPKTGRYSARGRMSSFVGFVPAEDPRLVILVVVDSPKGVTYGGQVAAPVFRRVAEYGLERTGIRPLAPPPAAGVELAALKPQPVVWKGPNPAGGMPSFMGLSMREALVQTQRAGWDVAIEGTGFVITQDPPPGTIAGDGRQLRLVFGVPAL